MDGISGEVNELLAKTFAPGDISAAREILDPSASPQVLRAIVTLSSGDLARLRHFADVAAGDARDVLYWAEHPKQPDDPSSYAELRDRLNLPD